MGNLIYPFAILEKKKTNCFEKSVFYIYCLQQPCAKFVKYVRVYCIAKQIRTGSRRDMRNTMYPVPDIPFLIHALKC